MRSRLVTLVVSLLLPALALAAFLIWDSSRQAYRLQERQLVATARTLSLVVDRQLSVETSVLRTLATSPALSAGDWRAFDDRARRALAGTRAWVVVRTFDGQQLVNTFAPVGATLPKVSNPRVRANRIPRADGVRIADLATGALAKEPVLIVVQAVTLADGRQVDLSIVTRAAAFSDLLRRQQLPGSWTATIVDGQHRVIARSRNEARFRGVKVPTALARHLTPGAAGVFWGRSLDGVVLRTAFEPVAGSDWNVVIGVPRQELEAPAVRAILVGSGIALLLLLVGVAAAARAAAGVAKSVEQLRLAAYRGVDETFTPPKSSGVSEIDDLAQAFASAHASIRERDAQQQLLINELNHRVKNTLATMQSVASHSRRSASTVDEFHAAVEGRIMAMSGAHELLTRTSWADTDLQVLARSALKPFEGPRLRIEGPPVQVEPTDTLNLSLIFYELATNALKHGALSGEAGLVRLSWEAHDGVVRISWVESGGPEVQAPTRTGFGSRLLTKARQTLHPSELRYDPDGLRCLLTLRVRAR